jgi:plasmid stabilization system protein ParE
VTEVIFHPLAELELIEAAQFYESRAAGLGAEFINEVERMLEQIACAPQAGNILIGTIRRRFVRRFPFAILYGEAANDVLVIALMHLRRRPGYWKGRMRDITPTGS